MGLRIRNLGLDDLLVDEDLSHLLAFLFPESLDDLELVADAEVTDAEVDVVLGVVGSADLAAGLHTVSQSGLDALALGLFELIDVLTAVVAEVRTGSCRHRGWSRAHQCSRRSHASRS